MYYIKELVKTRGNSPQACFQYSRLFFSIYYKTKDNAFKHAAKTWAKAVKRQEYFVNGHDIFIEKEVKSESDFKLAWMQIDTISKTTNSQVWSGNIFSHASKQENQQDGLEFIQGSQNDGTVKQSEILSLARLNWSEYGYLILSGCNTGLINDRGWAPAKAFAFKQKIPTLGQAGYAYFSNNWASYSEKNPSDTNICLWAFKRGKNGALGNGIRMPAKIFKL